MLPLSNSRILSFPEGHPVVFTFSSISSCPCCLYPNNVFEGGSEANVTNTVSLPSFCCMYDVLSSLTLCYTSSFFTRSVQLIFAILLQHISRLPTYLFNVNQRTIHNVNYQLNIVQCMFYLGVSNEASHPHNIREKLYSYIIKLDVLTTRRATRDSEPNGSKHSPQLTCKAC